VLEELSRPKLSLFCQVFTFHVLVYAALPFHYLLLVELDLLAQR
jgi:hypothetical protein